MTDKTAVLEMTHDLSNKLMILEGHVTLMGLDVDYITPENLQKLADTIASANQILREFKSNKQFQ